MSRHSFTLIALAALFLSNTAHASPYGASVRVNSSLPGGQFPVELVSNKHGETVVQWIDDTGGSFLKRYDAAGRVLASDQTLELGVRGVGIDEDGDVATLAPVGGPDVRVLVTLRDRSGHVTVPQFQVNDGPGVANATLAMNDSGNFIVAWNQTVAGTDNLLAKLYRSDGTVIAGPIVLAQTFSTGLDAAMDEQGNSIITWWQSRSGESSQFDVRAVRLSATGRVSPAMTINSDPSLSAANQRVAMNRAGAFLITWASSSGDQQGIRAQRFAVSGARIGAEIDVAPSLALWPDAALADDGSFTIVWDTTTSVMGRSFASNGTAIETFALSDLPGTNNFPKIGSDAGGNFTTFWRQSINIGDNTQDVYMRRYLPGGVAAPSLTNGQVVSGLAGARGSWRFYKITVPAGSTKLDVSIFNGTGDADLYVRWGALPNLEDWDGSPYLKGNNETVRMRNYPPGDWYIGVNGFAAYSGLSLRARSN